MHLSPALVPLPPPLAQPPPPLGLLGPALVHLPLSLAHQPPPLVQLPFPLELLDPASVRLPPPLVQPPTISAQLLPALAHLLTASAHLSPTLAVSRLQVLAVYNNHHHSLSAHSHSQCLTLAPQHQQPTSVHTRHFFACFLRSNILSKWLCCHSSHQFSTPVWVIADHISSCFWRSGRCTSVSLLFWLNIPSNKWLWQFQSNATWKHSTRLQTTFFTIPSLHFWCIQSN